MTSVKLIVGLGNPGPEYAATRHNVGAVWVAQLAVHLRADFKLHKRLSGRLASVTVAGGHTCHLFLPNTYMNESGRAVQAVRHFYQLQPSALLVVYDELDLPPGVIRLKQGGGHGGHNGVRDVIQHLHTPDFMRLRIGIGHPGHKDAVTGYVLSPPKRAEAQDIQSAMDKGFTVFDWLAQGQWHQAVQALHSVES